VEPSRVILRVECDARMEWVPCKEGLEAESVGLCSPAWPSEVAATKRGELGISSSGCLTQNTGAKPCSLRL
jgi:hypothetical protein